MMIDPDLPVEAVAQRLIGARLRTRIGEAETAVVVTEVEAYGGADDPASHAHRGPTRRNRSMFGPAGTIYVYRSYGIHWCINVVTGPAGTGQAVLLRAGEPVEGEAAMIRRRGRSDHIADGPGKLSQALGIDGSHDGLMLGSNPHIELSWPQPVSGTVLATPRVGISRERERPWRFVLAR